MHSDPLVDSTGLALGFVLAVSLALGCSSESEPEAPPRPVKAMRVLDASGLSSSTFSGRASPGQQANLSFRVAGPLIDLPVKVGDVLSPGDLVARIDPTDYQSLVDAAEGELQMMQAAATRARADFGRLQNTFRQDPGATSQLALDRALQARDSSSAAVRAAEAALGGVRDQLSYTSLRAPFEGEIVETYVENFETVAPKQPIARLVDSSTVEFVVNVPENLIGYAPRITRVGVRFDSLPDVTIPALVKEIGKEATQATRTYPITLVMDQPEGSPILAGMAGNARIEAELPENAREVGMQIPATAVFTEDDTSKSYVWVIDEASSTLERREVETGEISEFGLLIRGGLQAGEQIVVAGVTYLREAQRIVVLDEDGAKGGS